MKRPDIVGLSLTTLCLAAMVGCSASNNSAAPAAAALPESWALNWANSADPKLAQAFESYAHVRSRSPRGSEFASLALRVMAAAARRTIDGDRLVAFLGPPDFWKIDSQGSATLVYTYTNRPGESRTEILFDLDRLGSYVGVGFNEAGVNDYARLAFEGRGPPK